MTARSPAEVLRLIRRLYALADQLWDLFGEVVDAHERERLARVERDRLLLGEVEPF